jgi:uncharacterized membrane-anchored protein YitT (DUF2179 family)
MFYLKYLKRNAKYFLLDHKYLSLSVHHIYTLILCAVSALVFTIGMNSMINLNETATYLTDNSVLHLVTGGMSGISQCFVLILRIASPGSPMNYQLVQSIFYFCLNIPLLIFSFIKLGWKFSVYTTINVILVSLFLNVLPPSFFDQITMYVADNLLARAMLAGVCTGISIALAFKGGHSAGGVDIIGYFLSVKKSTNAGKYIGFINVIIILCFSLLNFFSPGDTPIGEVIIVALFSVLYQFMGSIVTDTIVKAAVKDALAGDTMKALLVKIAERWSADEPVVISAQEADELKAYFAKNAKALLDKGVEIKQVNGVKTSFSIAPADGSYKVNFGEGEFEAYFKAFLRPQLVELLFS